MSNFNDAPDGSIRLLPVLESQRSGDDDLIQGHSGQALSPGPGQILGWPSQAFGELPAIPAPHQAQDSAPPDPPRFHIPDDDLFRTPSGESVHDHESIVGESGRLYHGYKAGKYYLPNDAAEQDRLDLTHAAFLLLLNDNLSLVPFSIMPRYVLDIGTGTGIWANQYAERNPDAHVVGTDLSAIQPDPLVPNCYFQKDDIEDEWVFAVPDNKFDYIHLRLMVSCFNDPEKVMRSVFEHLNPGGWVEYQDSSLPIYDCFGGTAGSKMEMWNKYMSQGAAALGRDMKRASQYKQRLLEAGFVDIKEHCIQAPMVPWSKDPRLKNVGHYMLRSFQDGFRGISYAILRASGLSPPEVEQVISDAKHDLLDPKYGWCCNGYIVYGRKPFEGEVVVPQA